MVLLSAGVFWMSFLYKELPDRHMCGYLWSTELPGSSFNINKQNRR
jgi:hypothetical protein